MVFGNDLAKPWIRERWASRCVDSFLFERSVSEDQAIADRQTAGPSTELRSGRDDRVRVSFLGGTAAAWVTPSASTCHPDRSVPGFPTTLCPKAPRMRLSLRKGARIRSTPPRSTGNPGERSGAQFATSPGEAATSPLAAIPYYDYGAVKLPGSGHRSQEWQSLFGV
jgi:hypothetical protein